MNHIEQILLTPFFAQPRSLVSRSSSALLASPRSTSCITRAAQELMARFTTVVSALVSDLFRHVSALFRRIFRVFLNKHAGCFGVSAEGWGFAQLPVARVATL